MTVYVDDMRAQFGRMVMCHMLADNDAELLKMADAIGMQRKWHQYPGTHRSHFDIALSKRAEAVKAGAKEITWRETGMVTRHRRLVAQGKAEPQSISGILGDSTGAMAAAWFGTTGAEKAIGRVFDGDGAGGPKT